MHQSKLCTLVIDCPPQEFQQAVAFWSHALGRRPPEGADLGKRYVEMEVPVDRIQVLLQQSEDSPAVHLDIETDDVDAEVARLEAAGAERKRQVRTWWVMKAPSGHDFCVVKPQSQDFPAGANQWDGSGE
ncbi:Glyoxalase-6 domain-containing protein [Sulfidibacter corallicola]|uniref:Glyoxalase-like domain-containing protein n=1 Tax=Sulfidibacter corallicola TaxID=2818388 RepID=A0A8A4TRC5_SULCO|nr:VOC family protein [Sulfidibacter corallicola]QTD52519.1 hypothetical protein J3U87_08605 [Sulfidibacter corallicola]